MKISRFFVIGVSFFIQFQPALAASETDIDKLTTYATILGRAVACGNSIKAPMSRVGRWIDKKFPPDSNDQKIYLPIFMEGVRHHAKMQKDGKSPDNCSSVTQIFSTFPWL